jgi:hypothetical protein
MLDSIHTHTHTTYISISSLRGWKIKRLFTHTRQQQMAHKNYSVLSRPATVTPKKKFFFHTHRRRRRSNTPARSQERIPAVQSNSGGTYTTTTALYSERYFSKCITTKTSSILLRTAPVRSGLGLPFPFDSPSEYLLLLLVASDSTGRQEQQELLSAFLLF